MLALTVVTVTLVVGARVIIRKHKKEKEYLESALRTTSRLFKGVLLENGINEYSLDTHFYYVSDAYTLDLEYAPDEGNVTARLSARDSGSVEKTREPREPERKPGKQIKHLTLLK